MPWKPGAAGTMAACLYASINCSRIESSLQECCESTMQSWTGVYGGGIETPLVRRIPTGAAGPGRALMVEEFINQCPILIICRFSRLFIGKIYTHQDRGTIMKTTSTVTLCLFIALFFSACGCGKMSSPDTAPAGSKVTIFNWKEFTELSILKDFEKETGIKVELREYETMPMMIAEAQSNPGKYDVIMMDGNVVPIMKDLKLIEELDMKKIPNYVNVKEELRTRPMYDHQGKYSVPQIWGTTGLVYNTNYVKEKIDSWKVLWKPEYKGRVALMNDPREVMTVLLKSSGYSLNSRNIKELEVAEKKGLALKANGIRFGDTLGNIDKVMNGDLWIAEVYNGDVFYKIGDRKDIQFVNPKEGFNLWSNYICLSYDAQNREGAYRLINYFLRADMSARSTNRFCTASPIEGAEKFIHQKILNNPIVYPPRELIEKGEFYQELGETNKEYERIFNLIK